MALCREVQAQLEEVHEGKSSIIYELTEFQQAEMMFREVNIYLVQTFWFLARMNNLIKGWPEIPDCLQNTLNILPIFTWEGAQRKCLERGGPFKCSVSIRIPLLWFFLLPVKPIAVDGGLLLVWGGRLEKTDLWRGAVCHCVTACSSHFLQLSKLNGRWLVPQR